MHNGYVRISYVRMCLYMCIPFYTCVYIHTYKYLLHYNYIAAVAMSYVRLCQLCN